jgi:MFS family permease
MEDIALNRSFYALLLSQTSTNLGFALYTMGVVLYLYTETSSTTLSASVSLVSMLSRMFSGLLLPAVSDRLELPKLLRFAQITQLVLLLGLFILFRLEFTTTILIATFILIAFMSFFNGIFSPIKSTLVKGNVPENNRVKANSLIVSVDQTFLFAGWTFGGMLLAFLGIHTTLIITFCLFLVSILSLWTIKFNLSSQILAHEGIFRRLSTGWKYLFQHKGLRVIVIMDLIEAWVGTIWIGAVTLTFVNEALGKGESWWGYINGGYYLGTIIGGVIVFRLSKWMKGRLTTLMLIGAALFGLLTFVYGFASNAYFALILVIFMGPTYQIRDLAQETLLQNCTEGHILPKILAARSTLIELIFVFSVLVIGALTDLIGVRMVYILSGSLLLLSALIGFIFLKVLGNGLFLEEEFGSVKEC